MTVAPPLPDRKDAADRRLRRRPPWWAWTALGIAASIGLIAALGGFNDVPLARLPAVELGETFVGNEVETTVTGVYLTTRPAGQQYDAPEGMQYLVVEVTATNTTAEPSLLTPKLIKVLVPGVIDPYNDGAEFGGVLDPRTGDQADPLQPGLPTTLLYRWEVPVEAASVGDDVFVGVFERHRIYGDPVFGDGAFSTGAVVRIITTVGSS